MDARQDIEHSLPARLGPLLEHLADGEHHRADERGRIDEVERERIDVGRRGCLLDAAHREQRPLGVAREQIVRAHPVRRQQPAAVGMAALDLGGVGRMVGHHQLRVFLLVPAERRDVVVVAEHDPRLAGGRLGRRGAIPLDEAVVARADPPRHLWGEPHPDRIAQDRRRQPVDLDDHQATPIRDGLPVECREAAAELRVERRVLVAGHDQRDERGKYRDQDRGCHRRRERAHDQTGHQRCRQHQHDRVDDERQQTHRHDRQRKRQHHQHRSHQRVEQTEHDGGDERRHEVLDLDPGHEPADREQDDRLHQPREQQPARATTCQALSGQPNRCGRGIADRPQQAHRVLRVPPRPLI